MINNRTEDKYEDIIGLLHHQSDHHPHMSNYERAAQFSPFAALTGHDAAIKETARITECRQELEDEMKCQLDYKLADLSQKLNTRPEIEVTYFVPDQKKTGGRYVTVTGILRKIDRYKRMIVLDEQRTISVDDIREIEEK